MHNVFTAKYRAEAARRLQTVWGSDHFIGVGQHVTQGNDSVAATATDTVNQVQETHSNLIGGSKLSPNDVRIMLPRETWSSGAIFAQYDRVASTNSFVVVEQGATKFVYKCLFNNKGTSSTEVPSGTNTLPFETSDGYIWQYMFSIDETTFDRFATPSLIPFVEDTDVTDGAVGGTIDSITIVDSGLEYNNTTEGTLRAEDIATGSATTYKLSASSSAVNDFYNGCMLEITTPGSPAYNEMVEIVDYDGATKTATIDAPFSTVPNVNDTYEVSPRVVVSTNNDVSVEAKIRAIVTLGQVTGVVFGERGAGYRETTGVIAADPSVGATPAVVSVSSSPSMGHGADIPGEVALLSVCVQKDLSFPSLDIEETNDIRSVALMGGVKFNNVEATLESGNPQRFAIGETVKQYKERGNLSGNTTFSAPSTLSANTAALKVGDTVKIEAGSQVLLTNVTEIANSTTAVVESNFAGTFEGVGSIVDLTATGKVTARSGSDIILSDVESSFTAARKIYGTVSRSTDTVSSMSVANRSTLNGFNQTTRLTGSFTSGLFTEDEQIIGADGSSANVFSVNGDATVVAATNTSSPLTAQQYIGQSSGAVFNATSVVDGDLVLDSGQILFVNHITPISITSNKKVSTKIVIRL